MFSSVLGTSHIFAHIKKKQGQDVRKLVRSFESFMTKYIKVTAYIKLIKLCKVEKIIPTFAKVNLSIKSGSKKLKLRITRLVMESEIQMKTTLRNTCEKNSKVKVTYKHRKIESF